MITADITGLRVAVGTLLLLACSCRGDEHVNSTTVVEAAAMQDTATLKVDSIAAVNVELIERWEQISSNPQ